MSNNDHIKSSIIVIDVRRIPIILNLLRTWFSYSYLRYIGNKTLITTFITLELAFYSALSPDELQELQEELEDTYISDVLKRIFKSTDN